MTHARLAAHQEDRLLELARRLQLASLVGDVQCGDEAVTRPSRQPYGHEDQEQDHGGHEHGQQDEGAQARQHESIVTGSQRLDEGLGLAPAHARLADHQVHGLFGTAGGLQFADAGGQVGPGAGGRALEAGEHGVAVACGDGVDDVFGLLEAEACVLAQEFDGVDLAAAGDQVAQGAFEVVRRGRPRRVHGWRCGRSAAGADGGGDDEDRQEHDDGDDREDDEEFGHSDVRHGVIVSARRLLDNEHYVK